MSGIISFAKWIGPPGSLGFFLVSCSLGLAMAWVGPRGRRIAKVWFAVVFGAYLAGALPWVARSAADRLPPYEPVWAGARAGDADILVVLSGDNPRERAREARRIVDATAPRCVLVSGGRWFVRMVVASGVARDRLVVDDTTSTTREQIVKLSAWAEACGAERVILVASRISMPRIAALVRTAGVPVVLAPSALDAEPANAGLRTLVPSLSALRLTKLALYEHLALEYYRQNDWIQ